MRMQFHDLGALIFSEKAQGEFVHTSIAGFVCGAMFVLGISSFYLLSGRHRPFALRSFRMASLFGLVSTLAVITLGDAAGRFDYLVQLPKLAAMEGLWHTTTPPEEPWKLIALPDDAKQQDAFGLSIGIPYVLTPLVTHDFTTPIPGIDDLERDTEPKVEQGIKAVRALEDYAKNGNQAALTDFRKNQAAMGYGFLAQRFAPDQDLDKITPADQPAIVSQTAKATIPNVFVEFWAFRIMVGFGFCFLVIFAFAAYHSLQRTIEQQRWVMHLAMWFIPIPVLVTLYGWITTENGRQPWSVYGVLPTFQAASTHSVGYMIFSLVGFTALYTLFIAAELYLMFKYARLGPGAGASGPHAEPQAGAAVLRSGYAAAKSWE
jgi:cytochrome d ubiquinol oxidase subunit I